MKVYIQQLKAPGFSCADFSLNDYLLNKDLYNAKLNHFFDQTTGELESYFSVHKQAAEQVGIHINQMHMPYPIYVPNSKRSINEYLWKEVAPKSMQICAFFSCPNIVIHGLKLTRLLGTENADMLPSR